MTTLDQVHENNKAKVIDIQIGKEKKQCLKAKQTEKGADS
jgi:hypothetical protein